MAKGDRYSSEMKEARDPETGRPVYRLTGRRQWNVHPTYHVNGFLDDDRIAFAAEDGGTNNLYTCDLGTGEVLQLTNGRGSSYLLAMLAGERGDGRGTDAFHMVASYRRQRLYFVEGSEVRFVDARTLEEGLLATISDDWVVGVVELSGDEEMVLLPLLPRECFNTAGGLAAFLRRADHMNLTSRLLGVRVDGSGADVLWDDPGRFVGHAMFSPVSRRYVLADRATDPDRRDEPLLWIMDVQKQETWPLGTRNAKTGHSVWLWDGSGAVTHGVVTDGGEHDGAEYIQTLNLDGTTRWIGYHGPPRYYGHVHVTPDDRTIITDAIFRPDAITVVTPTGDRCRVETICLHRTEGPTLGQRSHPHPHVSPDGRWILFGAYRDGRKDLFAVKWEPSDEAGARRETGRFA